MAARTARADDAPAVAGRAGPRPVLLLGIAAGVAGLFWGYLRLSWTVAATSDGAAIALQARDMLGGNWLLHGWGVADVSFYTTELPEYVIVELARGLGTGTIHVAAAVTYTLLVLVSGLLARGRGRGADGAVRGLVAAGIMLAPQPGYGAFVLLLSPDHVGTEVPLLFGWLLLDLAPRRWYVPASLAVLLAWVEVGDRVALLTAAAPLALVSCWRTARARSRGGFSWRTHWFELSLAAAAVGSAGVAEAAVRALAAAGGFRTAPLRFAPSPLLPVHLRMTGEGILELFGASFAGVSGWPGLLFAIAHLAGLTLAAAGFALALGRCVRSRPGADLVSGVLAVAIVCNVVSYVITTDPGTSLGTGYAVREIAAAMPLGAVLAGRELGPLLALRKTATARSAWAARGLAGAVLACYAAALGYGAAEPAVPGQDAGLASWLVAHGLRYGLGEAVSNVTTVDSGGRVGLAVVTVRGGRVVPLLYQSRASDYDARLHDATFLVASAPAYARGDSREEIPLAAVLGTFGPPARVYYFSGYTVMTWKDNLLDRLRPAV